MRGRPSPRSMPIWTRWPALRNSIRAVDPEQDDDMGRQHRERHDIGQPGLRQRTLDGTYSFAIKTWFSPSVPATATRTSRRHRGRRRLSDTAFPRGRVEALLRRTKSFPGSPSVGRIVTAPGNIGSPSPFFRSRCITAPGRSRHKLTTYVGTSRSFFPTGIAVAAPAEQTFTSAEGGNTFHELFAARTIGLKVGHRQSARRATNCLTLDRPYIELQRTTQRRGRR